MVLRMARPFKHPKTGVLYYRGRVPADLPNLQGKQVTLTVAGESSRLTLGAHIKVSLRTKDAAQARVRNAEVETQLQSYWTAARTSELTLSFEQVCALAGDWYREEIAANEKEPGPDSADWESMQDLIADAMFWFERGDDGEKRGPKTGEEQLRKIIPIDVFLERRGLKLSVQSRREFAEQAGRLMWRAYERLGQLADGDRAEHLALFKRPTVWAQQPQSGTEHDLMVIFERWAREGERVAATIDGYRKYIQHFVEVIGHSDIQRITRKEVVAWKDALVERGDKPKTINDSKLAALKALLNWSVDNALIESNPALRVRVTDRLRVGSRMREFDERQAAAIFAAAEKQKSAVYRWVPILCALTGARVAEIGQLRREDIGRENGINFLDINAEAGSVKNEGSIRRVPIHPYLVETGFLEFVQSKEAGPLFYDPSKRKPGSKKHPAKIVGKNVGDWVRSLKLGIGRSFRKDPNHAWRHYFTTAAVRSGIEESIIEAIKGHASRTVSRRYGSKPLERLAREMERIPVPKLTER